MKHLILIITIVLFSLNSNSQFDISQTEIGVDGNISFSSNGGTAGLGLKFGYKPDETFIFGPSIRYQRTWNKNVFTGQKTAYNIFGGGAFVHARFFDVLFIGAEFEMLNSPINYTLIQPTSNWVPTFLLGGGYSQQFDAVRINLGLMYDVLDQTNSPFRQGYFLKRQNGSYVPLLYRIAFFFPLGNN